MGSSTTVRCGELQSTVNKIDIIVNLSAVQRAFFTDTVIKIKNFIRKLYEKTKAYSLVYMVCRRYMVCKSKKIKSGIIKLQNT